MKLPLPGASALARRLPPPPSSPLPPSPLDVLRRPSIPCPNCPPPRDWRAFADPPGTTYDPTIPFREWEDEARGLADFDERWRAKAPTRPAGMPDWLWEKKKRSVLRKMKKWRFDEGGELRGIRVVNEGVPLRIRDRLIGEGLKMQAQFQIGRYGISDDLVQHIRGAWRLHEIVRLQICSPWKDNMKELVKRLELKTGGLVLDRAGSRLLLYRGFTDMDLARKGITDPFQFQDDQEGRMEQNNTFVEFAEPSEIDDDDYYDSVKDDDDNGVDGVDDDGDGYAIEEAGEGESLEDEILGAQGRGQEPMNGKTEGSREKNARAVVYRSDVEEERSRRVGDVRMGAVAFGTEVGDEKAGGMGRDDAGSVVLGRELDEGEVREVGREGVGPMALGGEIEDRQRGTSVGIVGSGAVGRRPGGEAQSSLRGVGPGPKRDAGRRGAERYQRGAEGHGKSWERNRRDAAMSRAGDSAAVTGRLWRDAKRRNDDDDDDDDCDESAGPLGPLDNEAAGGMGAGPRAAAMGERVSDSGAFGDDEAGGLEELSELDISAAARNRPGRTASSARSRRR